MTTRPTDAEVNSRERIQIRASGSGSQRRRSAVALVVRPLHTMRLDKNHRRWSIGGFYNFEASFVGAILMVVGGIPLGAAFHSGLHWLAWVSLLPLILGAWLVGWKPSRISPTFHTENYGGCLLYYAKVPAIAFSPDGDTCPLLRAIVTDDLRCGKITEISGEGETYWDFIYKGTPFTCHLLRKQCRGSWLYPASATRSTDAERELLRQLVQEIVFYAHKREA